jgi:hemolysin activation/secretion protein
VLPADHFTHKAQLGVQFARGGYRLNLEGAIHQRSEWEFWGLPGNTEFDPDSERYTTWQASVAKNWYFPGFKKFGLELDYLDGSNLDRFSKYQFGFFGGSRVHGYQIGKVRAEQALALHTTAGIEIGNVVRLDLVGDVAQASDEISGLDNDILAGVGLSGSFVGPWQTLVQVDVGAPVAGPDDGFVAYLVFLKLFN